jgi:hypothetical protein
VVLEQGRRRRRRAGSAQARLDRQVLLGAHSTLELPVGRVRASGHRRATASHGRSRGWTISPASIGEGFRFKGASVPLGAACARASCRRSLPGRRGALLLNRPRPGAGATGTGKTKTLQGMAEKLSAAGVPVFLRTSRATSRGWPLRGGGVAGRARARFLVGVTFRAGLVPGRVPLADRPPRRALRTTVADFGPLLLAKALDLERHPGVRTFIGIQVCRRSAPAAARPSGPARRGLLARLGRTRRTCRSTAGSRSRLPACWPAS